MLIERCVCGRTGYREVERFGIRVGLCECGTGRQLTEKTEAEYFRQYLGEYHNSESRHDGCVPYRERYEHDRSVAGIRWRRYGVILGDRIAQIDTALDVGVGNGAFVDFLAAQGVAASGVDPDPPATRNVMQGTVRDIDRVFDLVTYHDVLEHIVDPAAELAAARRIGRLLIVDVPDVFDGHGDHHYKAEHLWYFSQRSLAGLAEQAGFRVLATDKPIPGKTVLFCE